METEEEKTAIESALNNPYRSLLGDEHRYLLLYGGAGSGKSYFAAQKILWRIMKEPNHRILLCRKVARTVFNSQFRLLKDLIIKYGFSSQFAVNSQRMDMTCLTNGNQIISMGVDDPEKLKSLAQPTSIWIEEATELSPREFKQLDLRLRAITHTYQQVVLTFNPISRTHWLYSQFFAQHNDGAHILQTKWDDNTFLDQQYHQVLEGMKTTDPTYYSVYALGEWGTRSEGLVYQYELVDKKPEVDTVIYGLDFGFNNPTVLVKVGIQGQDLYVDEVVYKHNITNSDLIPLVKQYIPDKRIEIYADASEPGRIEDIYREGYNIHSARKDVMEGIDKVKGFRLHVVRGSINLIKELDSYQWKQDKNGIYLDVPEKANDHACDAMRYAVNTHLSRKRLKIKGFV